MQARDNFLAVMRGLDPRIHDEGRRMHFLRLKVRHVLMDGRVKPGNDKARNKVAS